MIGVFPQDVKDYWEPLCRARPLGDRGRGNRDNEVLQSRGPRFWDTWTFGPCTPREFG